MILFRRIFIIWMDVWMVKVSSGCVDVSVKKMKIILGKQKWRFQIKILLLK